MPIKGLFSQGMVILLSAPSDLDAVCELLAGMKPMLRPNAGESWEMNGPGVLIPYRPEVNGHAIVDLADCAWPDKMGHPQQEPELFAAWSMGFFGPLTFPGNLERAVQQARAWPKAKEVVPQHRAFVRVRTTYAPGAAKDDPVLPQDYQPLPELSFATEIVLALLRLPSALCYFNPGGEMLLGAVELSKAIEHASANGFAPLNAWTNVRMYSLENNWMMMDSVGMQQLDLPDHMACFQKGRYEARLVAPFLRNMALYTLDNGDVIKEGDTADGPGEIRWQARRFGKPMVSPPRPILCWLPCDGMELPPAILSKMSE